MSGAYIYILGSHTGTLYIGVTSNLYLRVMQHKEGTCSKRLLYFEGYEDIRAAPDPAFGLRWSKSSEQHG